MTDERRILFEAVKDVTINPKLMTELQISADALDVDQIFADTKAMIAKIKFELTKV